MGQYGRIKCPICSASIETDKPVERCPACKEYILDKFNASGGGTGITTATAQGPGLRPLGGLINDVY